MSDPVYIPAWQRPLWKPSEEEILLQFYVFGQFTAARVPSEGYGSKGLPEGIELTSHHHAALRQWEGYPLKGSLGKMLKDDVPEIYQAALATPEVLVVRGQIKDSPATGYLRDTLGVLSGLLDVGGKAILDPQVMSLFDRDSWRRRYLIKDGAPIRNHVLILRDDEPAPGRCWIHTRGMRKFGRPDLSFRNVPDRYADRAGAMCEKLVEVQAMGAHFDDGQLIEVGDLPGGGLRAHLIGDLANPDFNNTAVEIRWPD